MILDIIIIIIKSVVAIIMLITALVMNKSIKSNESIARSQLLHEWVMAERQLRRDIVDLKDNSGIIIKGTKEERRDIVGIYNVKNEIKNREIARLERLFNFYEGLAIYIFNKSINEEDTKKYFELLVKEVYKLYKDQANEKIENKVDNFGLNNPKRFIYLKNLIVRWGINKI